MSERTASPTLLVGLGGSGASIVKQVYKLANKEQLKNISIVVFDTDINMLQQIQQETPAIKTIQISTKLTVGEYLDIDRVARDEWFPVNGILNGKSLIVGAGQVRAVSRLALNTAIRQGKLAPLNEAINDLYRLKGSKIETTPTVIITGSLCGGTGSGLFLPVSLYIRNFMTSKFQNGTSIIRGFFLLPEVFKSVISTQEELNNLKSNAYAAVRELNAFMMKSDGHLDSQYDLHFYAPRPGADEIDEYTGSPMDYCFLFDAQNMKGEGLENRGAYFEHAANCIYAMAIAPTSSTASSTEDNNIRTIAKAGGRNRFAGAGTSMLIYPEEDVKRYLGMSWTKDNISREWTSIDKVYHERLKLNKQMMDQGLAVQPITRGQVYIETIDSRAAEEQPFASRIKNLCRENVAGFNKAKAKGTWQAYWGRLIGYLDKEAERKKNEVFGKLIEELQAKKDNAKNSGDAGTGDFEEWFAKLQEYQAAVEDQSKVVGQTIAYSLFKDKSDYSRTKEEYRIEYWLRTNGETESFIHPNAIRYFLYQLEKQFDGFIPTLDEALKQIRYPKAIGDDKDTSDIESPEYLKYLDIEGFKKLVSKKNIEGARTAVEENLETYEEDLNKYWTDSIKLQVLKRGREYVHSLNDAFEKFYDSLDANIGRIETEMALIERKYEYKQGHALRYVCADQKCLRAMAEQLKSTSSGLNTPAEVCRSIYGKVRDYTLQDTKPAQDAYFRNVFRDTILEEQEKEVLSAHGTKINKNIIQALWDEAGYEDPETYGDFESQKKYAKNMIEKAKGLALPFIESPNGKEAMVKTSCSYSTELTSVEQPGEVREFVQNNLTDNSAPDDSGSINKNMILYYSAVYGLQAADLTKFAPVKDTETYHKGDGDYYKAYHELIDQLNPDPTLGRVITPHIDRWWHVITKLPELDEEDQQKQIDEIYRAFFWGMLNGYIILQRETRYHFVYNINKVAMGFKTKDKDELNQMNHLVVSNGTPCDNLYEVLDAFTIYPHLVKYVLKQVDTRRQEDMENHLSFNKSLLMERIRRFKVDEMPLRTKKGESRIRSIFELPVLMKLSVPKQKYFEDNMHRLFEVILAEMREYMKDYFDSSDLDTEYGKLLLDQYNLFLNDLKDSDKLVDKNGNKDERMTDQLQDITSDPLVHYISDMVAEQLYSLDLREESEAVRSAYQSFAGTFELEDAIDAASKE